MKQREKKKILHAIYSFGSHLQNKLNCQHEPLTATAGKDTSCSAPATPQTTKHFLPIISLKVGLEHPKITKFQSGWLIHPDRKFHWSLYGFIFLHFNKCGDTLWTQRGCFQFLHLFLKVRVWFSAFKDVSVTSECTSLKYEIYFPLYLSEKCQLHANYNHYTSKQPVLSPDRKLESDDRSSQAEPHWQREHCCDVHDIIFSWFCLWYQPCVWILTDWLLCTQPKNHF